VVYDDGFVDAVPVRFPDNAILLAGAGVVKKRPVPPAKTVSM
jgi:hypothetical protein